MKRDGFLCLECGDLFESPVTVTEPHGEQYAACPRCFASCFVPALECDACGEVIREDYIRLWNGEDYCQNCFIHKNIEAGD